MKITRNAAMSMYEHLGAMSLGYLTEKTLEVVMSNFSALAKVASEMNQLKKELISRIYQDIEESLKKAFFELISKMEIEKDIAKKEALAETAKAEYGDVWKLYAKHINVIISLLEKEVEIEIEPVDEQEFMKGVLMGKKDAPIREIKAVFSPMFKTEPMETDLSELDDLLKTF